MQKANNTKRFLEQAYGKKLSGEEVLKYKNRLVKFFALLIEIDQRNNKKQKRT